MGKVNSCLKLAFILLNVVFVVFGFLTIHVAVLHKRFSYEVSGFKDFDPLKTWVFVIIIISIAIVGIYAATAENTTILKIFAVLMILMIIIYLIVAIAFTVMRKVMQDEYNKSKETFDKTLLKEEQRNQTEAIQQLLHCCGVVSVADWGTNIPKSCECSPTESSNCKPRPQGTTGPAKIFSKSCSNLIFEAIMAPFTAGMAIFYGFVGIGVSFSFTAMQARTGHGENREYSRSAGLILAYRPESL